MSIVAESFSQATRMAIADSQQEARRLGHTYIGTGHLLLAAIKPDGRAARGFGNIPLPETLRSIGISYDAVRNLMEARAVGREAAVRREAPAVYVERDHFIFAEPIDYHEPLSQELMDSLHSAALSHMPVEPGHVMEEVLRRPNSDAAQILASMGK
jgi:ATP-dependent Clp protease ATP-binding subunit ClpA